MADIIQINKIKRAIGQFTIQVGMKQIWDAISEFTDTEGDFDRFQKRFQLLGIPVSQLDTKYYFISWDNWLRVIETINPILK